MGKAEKAAPLKGNIETLHELACLPIADVNFSGSVAYRQPLVSVVRKLRLSVVNAKPSRETTLGSSAPGAKFRRGTLGIIAFNNRARSQKIWTTGVWEELPLRGIRVEVPTAADFSPDDRFVALGYKDQDVATRHLLETLPGPPAWVRGVTICGDSRRAALGGSNTKEAVILWDLAARRELLNLPAEGQFFLQLSFSPDGNTLAATSLAGIAHLWRAPSWAEIEAVEKGAVTP